MTQCLNDEVRHHPAISGVHARAIGVEDPRDLGVEPVLAAIVEEQRLGAALTLVIAAARADRIDVAPVCLGLGMDGRVAVDLAGRGLKDRHTQTFGEAQHVDRAVHAGLGRLDRIVLVMDRGGRAGEVEDRVHFDKQRETHVMAHEFEPRMLRQVIDIALVPSEQIVDAQNLVPAREQAVNQVRAKEARASGDKNAAASVRAA